MGPLEYSSNRKGIMALMEYTPMVYRPNEKGMVLWKTVFFEVMIVRVKDKKTVYKRHNVNKN